MFCSLRQNGDHCVAWLAREQRANDDSSNFRSDCFVMFISTMMDNNSRNLRRILLWLFERCRRTTSACIRRRRSSSRRSICMASRANRRSMRFVGLPTDFFLAIIVAGLVTCDARAAWAYSKAGVGWRVVRMALVRTARTRRASLRPTAHPPRARRPGLFGTQVFRLCLS